MMSSLPLPWPMSVVKESSGPNGEEMGTLAVLPRILRMFALRIVRTADGHVWALDPSYQSLRAEDDDAWMDLEGWYSFRTAFAGATWKFGSDIDPDVLSVEIVDPSPVVPDMGRTMTVAEVELFCRALAMAD